MKQSMLQLCAAVMDIQLRTAQRALDSLIAGHMSNCRAPCVATGRPATPTSTMTTETEDPLLFCKASFTDYSMARVLQLLHNCVASVMHQLAERQQTG